MKKVASFLVEKRKILLCLFLVLAAVSLPLMGQVRINYDLTKYLSAESRMKQGMQLMEQEFGPSDSSQLMVMIPDLSASEKEDILHDLEVPSVVPRSNVCESLCIFSLVLAQILGVVDILPESSLCHRSRNNNIVGNTTAVSPLVSVVSKLNVSSTSRNVHQVS